MQTCEYFVLNCAFGAGKSFVLLPQVHTCLSVIDKHSSYGVSLTWNLLDIRLKLCFCIHCTVENCLQLLQI